MTDLASLVLEVDSSQVPKGTAALDGLTAAGKRAETQTEELTAATRASGVAAAQAAASAQMHARAAVGLGSASNMARFQMLELSHVATSLSGAMIAGISPIRAFAMEMPRIAQAASMGGTGFKGMALAVGGMLAPFAGLVAVAGLAATAFLGVKQAADDIDPSAKHLISTLGLTGKEVEKLKGTTVSWGDIAVSTFDVLAKAGGTSASQITGAFGSAYKSITQFGIFSAQVILAAFAAAVKGVYSLVSNLPQIAAGLAIPGLQGLAIQGVKNVGNDTVNQFRSTFAGVGAGFDRIEAGASAHRDARVRREAANIIGDRTPRRERHPRGASGRADDSVANERNYDDQVSRLNDQILQAKRALAGGVQDQATFALQDIENEKNKTIADAQALLKQGKINAAQESYLETKAEDLATVKAMKIERDRELASMQAAQAMTDQNYQVQVDALKYADDMAMTQKEHRTVQLEMLDIEYKQKEAQLKALLAQEALANDWSNYAINAAKLFNLPNQKAQDRGRIMQGTQDPLQQWAQSVPQTAAQVTQALQGIEVQGLDGLSSAIAGVVTGTTSLKHAFKDLAQSIISDIIQMTVKMLIFRALSSVMGGSKIPSISLPAFGSANGNIFAGGNVVPFATGGIVGGPTLFPMAGGRTGLMGEAGPEAVMPLTRDGQGRLGVRAANSNTPQRVELVIGFGDAPDFAPYVQNVAGQSAATAVQISIDHTNRTMKNLRRQPISGGRG